MFFFIYCDFKAGLSDFGRCDTVEGVLFLGAYYSDSCRWVVLGSIAERLSAWYVFWMILAVRDDIYCGV